MYFLSVICKLWRKTFRDLYKPYWWLVALRILLVFFPQTGYLHPDEYFQSIEILIGRFFEVEVSKPWEFTTKFPIRSMVLPYLIVGTSYKILQFFNTITMNFFAINLISPYTLLLAPRLMICSLSFLVDFSMYKICVNNNEKYRARLLILASSYVMLVYATRTLSNTIELILFALLLYHVADSMTFSNMIIKQKEYLNKRHKQAKSLSDKARFHKLRLFLAKHTLRNSIQVTAISVFGFFNRPTFVTYAVIPVFFWLYRGIGYKSFGSLNFHLRILVFLLLTFPFVFICVLIDSLFYGYLILPELEFATVTINNFVVTPLNFIRYNLNNSNLENHGLHPHYTHVLINVPLLFNVLGIFAIIGISGIVRNVFARKLYLLPTIRSIKCLMTTSLMAPVAVLSYILHQEARFIIPILFPMIYLYTNKIYEEQSTELEKLEKTKEALTFDYAQRKLKAKKSVHVKIWIVANIICLLFFGFIHQGGVYKATSHLQSEMKERSPQVYFKIYSSLSYSIPESLFMQRSTEKLYRYDKIKYKVAKRVEIHEEGSKDLDLVLQGIVESYKNYTWKIGRNETYIMLPTFLQEDLQLLALGLQQQQQKQNLNFKISFIDCVNFYPHLSTEALSHININIGKLLNFYNENMSINKVVHGFMHFIKHFGLTLCRASVISQ